MIDMLNCTKLKMQCKSWIRHIFSSLAISSTVDPITSLFRVTA